MLYFWLMLAVVAAGLMLAFWVGSMFLQGYIYTEPSRQLMWGAPAAGGLLAAFLAWWCYVVATSSEARPEDIPYNTLFTFSPRVEMVDKPVKELWAVKKNDEKVLYRLFRSPNFGGDVYKDTTTAQRPWNGNGVKAIEIQHGGETFRFVETVVGPGEFPHFINDKGWSMKVYESGPTGIPTQFRMGRFLANLFFNFTHLALWFVGLWLLARFQWSHALGIGFCMWLLFTLAVLPMLLEYSARVAQTQATRQAFVMILALSSMRAA